jgi:serine protease AprX
VASKLALSREDALAKTRVLIEVMKKRDDAFQMFGAAMQSERAAVADGESLLSSFGDLGLEVLPEFAPVPMFGSAALSDSTSAGLQAFSATATNPDRASESFVVSAELQRSQLDDLRGKPDVKVYEDSPIVLLGNDCPHCRAAAAIAEASSAGPAGLDLTLFDLAPSASGVDCRPFRPAVSLGVIRELLGVDRIWQDGFRGQNIIVGIIDEGVDGTVYPVVGGFTRPDLPQPGTAHVSSHGSMCAADVLVAAPQAKLYDYPFLGQPRSGGALAMFQEVLSQRRLDGTPHLTNNSYGFVGVPPQNEFPNHEIHDITHPLHRKVREVIASGCPCFFAAGNCGEDCPSGNCHVSGIGPQRSIHASNSLAEVITVAAVNSRHDRIGYSSQGDGMFERRKPDLACYSHFFGNFGPGRPAGGGPTNFDNGTSAATPVACGVGALLMSAFADLDPRRLKEVLISGASNLGRPGWDRDTGHGVINAAASYMRLLRQPAA